ncbi:MAG: NAD(P)H-binding protein [Chloroflexota bacterium]
MDKPTKTIKRFALFGASGRTGIPLIKQGLAAGYEIKAFVRDPAKLTLSDPQLHPVQGNAMNWADVERCVVGTDAVISVLGHVPGEDTPENMQTAATRHIIKAMRDHGIKRFVSLTGAGVPAPGDRPKWSDRLVRFMLKTTQRKSIGDAENHFEVIQAYTDIEWVVVRGPMLTEDPATGSIRVGLLGDDVGMRLTREDLAAFILEQLQDDQWVHRAPVISN